VVVMMPAMALLATVFGLRHRCPIEMDPQGFITRSFPIRQMEPVEEETKEEWKQIPGFPAMKCLESDGFVDPALGNYSPPTSRR